MQALYKRFSVITGFVILLVVLASNTWVTRHEVGDQIEEHDWVVHTERVVAELRQIELLLKNAETGQRGFLYTGEPKYLAPYDLAAGQVDSEIDKLADMTKADHSSQKTQYLILAPTGSRQIKRTRNYHLALPLGSARGSQKDRSLRRRIVHDGRYPKPDR